MSTKDAQRRAVVSYRTRRLKLGMVRFELQALDADRALLRALAHKLAADGPEAQSIRHLLAEAIGGAPPTPGGVLAALLRSPLVGAELGLDRVRDEGRKVDL